MPRIIGDDRDNRLVGTDGPDDIEGQGGDDRLDGSSGDDRLYGGSIEANALYPLGNPDIRGGNDTLIGGAGDDQLWGDFGIVYGALGTVTRGADRFVLAQGSDRDTILDFEHGRDTIDLTGYRGIDGFAEVRAHATQGEAGAVIDLGAAAGGPAGEDVLTLAGIDLATLGARDFLFA